MTTNMPLGEVARLTGQPEQRLRRWCATGVLECEPNGASWEIASELVGRVILLAEAKRLAPQTSSIALIVPKPVEYDLGAAVERHLGLPPKVVCTADLVIDRQHYVVATWAQSESVEHRPALFELASTFGGELLDVEAV